MGRLSSAGSRILSLSAVSVVTGNVDPMAHYHYVKAHRGSGGKVTHFLNLHSTCRCGPGSSVGIATDYGLDGPGSNPGGDEIFRPSRPVLRPTQPPVKWVQDLSRG